MKVYNKMHNNNNHSLFSSQAKAQQIIEYCRQKFINILPNTAPKSITTGKRITPVSDTHELSAMGPIIYKKQEVKQIMRQLSIFLQLVIQNCLLSSDTKVKTESYRILGNFRNLLSGDLDNFQMTIYSRNKNKLPFYEIQCEQFAGKNLDLQIPPQVSLYQDPLLFYIYTKQAQDTLFNNHSIHTNRQEKIEILKTHVPFLDPLFIPIIYERLETKAKFSEMQDRLLLILVKSKLDITQYRSIYFPHRLEAQIKNRIKNLSGCGKQISNPIKQARMNQYLPLNQEEIEKLTQAYVRFGPRWPVIAKYYINRSAEFLEAEYNNCIKLKKRREKQKINVNSVPLNEILQNKLEELNKKNNEIDLEKSQQQAAEEEKGSENGQAQQQQTQQVFYKIINHLTFEYIQI